MNRLHARRYADPWAWTLDPGPWTLYPGPWTLDRDGPRTAMDRGPWTLHCTSALPACTLESFPWHLAQVCRHIDPPSLVCPAHAICITIGVVSIVTVAVPIEQ